MPPYVRKDRLQTLIQAALLEDVDSGDITSIATIPAHKHATAILKAKEEGIIAGLLVFEAVLIEVDQSITSLWTKSDGDHISSGAILGTISGPARSILMAERLALNFLQRMSGIATLTNRMVQALNGTNCKLLDTRKTAPGLRMLDKWAVLLGGGLNHRVGLFDMMLIKENHIAAAGGIENALNRANEWRLGQEKTETVRNANISGAEKRGSSPSDIKIEIEVTSMEELARVLAHGGADRVMLDNFVGVNASGHIDTAVLEKAVKMVNGQMETEASGNVTLDSLGAIGRSGVDYISSGALTHSVKAMDFSLLITIEE